MRYEICLLVIYLQMKNIKCSNQLVEQMCLCVCVCKTVTPLSFDAKKLSINILFYLLLLSLRSFQSAHFYGSVAKSVTSWTDSNRSDLDTTNVCYSSFVRLSLFALNNCQLLVTRITFIMLTENMETKYVRQSAIQNLPMHCFAMLFNSNNYYVYANLFCGNTLR